MQVVLCLASVIQTHATTASDNLYALQDHFKRFRADATEPANDQKLFLMIVDECHYGATRQQAHDTYVNDYNWLDDEDSAQHGPKRDKRADRRAGHAALLQQKNVLTLLVSATPYSMLTCNSRLPETLFVPHHMTEDQLEIVKKHGLHPLAVLDKQEGQWSLRSNDLTIEQLGVPSSLIKQLIEQQV